MSVMVFPRHIRAAKLCTRGARAWFNRQGLDWNECIEKGIPDDVLTATGDPLAIRAANVARQEAENG